MNTNRPVRYCRCGTRLARDNPGRICSACQGKARDLLVEAPKVPAEFWSIEQIRDALASWHMGRVIAAYRRHPHHGQFLRQEVVARWAGLTQAQLSRIENGPPIKDLDRLVQWARILGIPAHLLWFRLPDQPGQAAGSSDGTEKRGEATVEELPWPVAGEIDDVNRRELLRVVSMTGSVVAADPLTQLDFERMLYTRERPVCWEVPTADKNEQLRYLREHTPSRRTPRACMGRQELAELVNEWIHTHRQQTTALDKNYIGKLEAGKIHWPDELYRAALREILGATNDAQLGFYDTRRMPPGMTVSDRQRFLERQVGHCGGTGPATAAPTPRASYQLAPLDPEVLRKRSG
jgi:transcriptional regulator with XRE-family HTH domain